MRVLTIVVVEGEKRLPSDPWLIYPVHISQLRMPDPSDNTSPPKMTKAHIVSTRLCPVFFSGSFQASSKVVHYFDSDFSSALKGLATCYGTMDRYAGFPRLHGAASARYGNKFAACFNWGLISIL
jgi:hypothetical protein